MGSPEDAPVASWTPRQEWLMRALSWDGLLVARTPDFASPERLILPAGRDVTSALTGPVPIAIDGELWLRLAPVDRGHPWRDGWRVRLWSSHDEDEVLELSAAHPDGSLHVPAGASIRAMPETAPAFARASPLEGCAPVPLLDAAFARHTRQSSAAREVAAAQTAGDWMTPTAAEPAPWWEIDLGASHLVEHIAVHGSDALTLTVEVFAYHRPDGRPAAPHTVTLAPGAGARGSEVDAVGRFVRVTGTLADGVACALALGAVEVMAAALSGGSLLRSACRSFTLFAERPLFSRGDFTDWTSYRQVWERAVAFGRGLAARLGDGPERIFVGLCAGGRQDWVVADLACIQRGYVVVPLAFSDGPDRLAHIARECNLRAVVCSPEMVPVLGALDGPSLELVVEMAPVEDERPAMALDHVAHVTSAALEAEGRSSAAPFVERPGGELYTVLYTSGSTGHPKGAMRSYDAFDALVDSYGSVQPAVHLSFQPLSHLSERMMLPTMIRNGARVGFASGDAARLFDEVSRLQPTVFGGVPRIFDVLRAQYEAALEAHRVEHPDADEARAAAAVLPRFRALFGDRLQAVSVGSAKPSEAVLAFMRACFSDCWVNEGYGSTEVGTIAVNGAVVPGVEVILIEVPELGYYAGGLPERGEICVRTPHMISGYLGRDSTFDDAGYFHTGDLGERGADGVIRVIGRRTNVVKLAQGEFVAPERIEAALMRAPVVDQIYVHADAQQACVVAVVVPNPALTGGDAEAVRAALGEVGRAAGLASYELPAAVHLAAEAMTVENGLLTSSNKPNRRAIAAHYSTILDALYQQATGSVLAAVRDVASALVGAVDLRAPIERAGVDSLASVQLVCMLEERLQRPVSMEAWFAATSLEDLARRVHAGGAAGHAEARADLERSLPFTRVPGNRPPPRYRSVLLTGATGFLGAGLLAALLEHTDATLYCLVRGDRDRVPAGDRVRVIAADLAAPRLGLDDASWAELAEVDAIIHAAAQVNWITLYGQLRAANVLGTLALLELAASGTASAFHFVSTISTAPADGDESTHLPEDVAFRSSGYGLSKWIAEEHVRRAGAAGLPVAIYRPAMIAGHSQHGRSNADDFGNRYLCGSAAMGLHLDLHHRLDMTPVDFVAEAIVALSREPATIGQTYHLVNLEQSPSYRALGAAMRAAGVPVEPADYPTFRAALLAAARAGGNALTPLLSYFPAAGFGLAMGPWPSARTRAALEALGVRCPPIDDALIARYVASLRERGLIDSEKLP